MRAVVDGTYATKYVGKEFASNFETEFYEGAIPACVSLVEIDKAKKEMLATFIDDIVANMDFVIKPLVDNIMSQTENLLGPYKIFPEVEEEFNRITANIRAIHIKLFRDEAIKTCSKQKNNLFFKMKNKMVGCSEDWPNGSALMEDCKKFLTGVWIYNQEPNPKRGLFRMLLKMLSLLVKNVTTEYATIKNEIARYVRDELRKIDKPISSFSEEKIREMEKRREKYESVFDFVQPLITVHNKEKEEDPSTVETKRQKTTWWPFSRN
jgi:hypothetical protein